MIANHKDFASGLMFTIVGAAFAVGAGEYSMGTAARMGPGFFPKLLGIVLALLGVVLAVKSLGGQAKAEGRIGRWAWRPLFFIITANFVFGALLGGLPVIGLPAMGLLVAIFSLVLISSLAGQEFVLKEALILGVILATASYVLFVVVLKLPFQILPAFLAA